MVGWKVLVRSVYGVVFVKFVVTPSLKEVDQHNGVPNIEADYSQDLPSLECQPAAIHCPQACNDSHSPFLQNIINKNLSLTF